MVNGLGSIKCRNEDFLLDWELKEAGSKKSYFNCNLLSRKLELSLHPCGCLSLVEDKVFLSDRRERENEEKRDKMWGLKVMDGKRKEKCSSVSVIIFRLCCSSEVAFQGQTKEREGRKKERWREREKRMRMKRRGTDDFFWWNIFEKRVVVRRKMSYMKWRLWWKKKFTQRIDDEVGKAVRERDEGEKKSNFCDIFWTFEIPFIHFPPIHDLHIPFK